MLTLSFILFSLLLVLIVTFLVPAPTSATHPAAVGWAKLGIWSILELLTIVAVLTHVIILR
jgi:succinate dehydrogenase hydrophobic anchor subunit